MTGWVLAGVVAALVLAFLRERRLRRTHPMSGGLHREISLPHAAEWELYHNAFSLCSKKARMCMAELELPYASHEIDLIETGSYETLSRRFLAVNPAGLVPVLVHRGHPVYESHELIRYAALHAPGGDRLTPSDPARRAEMERWIDRSSLVGDDPVKDLATSAGNCVPGLTVPLFAAMIRFIPTHRILEGLLFHRIRSRPLMFLALKRTGLARLHTLAPVRRAIAASRRELARHLDELEQQLAKHGGPWLVGAEFTLADVSWAVIFERLREAEWLEELAVAARPHVRDWWERIRARPSYPTAMLEHPHPLVLRGSEAIRAEKARNPAFRAAIYDGGEGEKR